MYTFFCIPFYMYTFLVTSVGIQFSHAPLGFHWVSSKPMSIAKEEMSSTYSWANTANRFLRWSITYKIIQRTYKYILFWVFFFFYCGGIWRSCCCFQCDSLMTMCSNENVRWCSSLANQSLPETMCTIFSSKIQISLRNFFNNNDPTLGFIQFDLSVLWNER